MKLSVFEISKQDKEHSHTIIDVKNKSTFIQQFHKKFNKKYVGNKSYSCEELRDTPEMNYQYCCKGNNENELPDVLYSGGLFVGDIEKYHQAYWVLNKQMSKKNETIKKAVTTTFMDKVIKNCSAQLIRDICYYNNIYSPSESEQKKKELVDFDLYKIMLKNFGSLSKILDASIEDRMFKGLVNKILMENGAESPEEYLKRKFEKMMNKN
ncbi:hypothetical protein [uncultured Mucilaginibacter sp.]|uniref:hypothetical protein n=1 Tax=uncultured Mucilaginibacter sp. TaxID=797541 RepID=UPI0025DB6EEE|nr:hypothetical protein [uncultured Mucilaginibacter sp.]